MNNDFIQNAVNNLYRDNELVALTAENARLKAEVEKFKFTLEEERQIAREDWAGLRHENARLKAEVERLTKQKAVYIDNDKVLAEMERLKAEVKEKTALIAKLHKDAEISDRESMSDEYDLNHQTKVINGLLRDKEKLQAQVEKLTKAGDEVIHEWSSGHGTDVENFTKALWVWTVAKEGKQS